MRQGVMEHVCNPSTLEFEAGGSKSRELTAILLYLGNTTTRGQKSPSQEASAASKQSREILAGLTGTVGRAGGETRAESRT